MRRYHVVMCYDFTDTLVEEEGLSKEGAQRILDHFDKAVVDNFQTQMSSHNQSDTEITVSLRLKTTSDSESHSAPAPAPPMSIYRIQYLVRVYFHEILYFVFCVIYCFLCCPGRYVELQLLQIRLAYWCYQCHHWNGCGNHTCGGWQVFVSYRWQGRKVVKFG